MIIMYIKYVCVHKPIKKICIQHKSIVYLGLMNKQPKLVIMGNGRIGFK